MYGKFSQKMFAILIVVATLLAVDSATPYERAVNLVGQMTISEKLVMLSGHKGIYVGNIDGNERLSIPALKMQDGPQGFRVTETTGKPGTTTAWPSALSIAASWDESLLYRWGSAMADEFKGKGANVALAPGIGIARVPTAGRNFEYLSGEDPVLGSYMGRNVVKGIQDRGVIANAKHWINNEIEDERMRVSANVGERVRFELYYPPFQAAVDAGVLSVMCSYNRINDVYACQNNETLSHLRDVIGFNGWVMSDWTATKSTVKSMKAGMDQEMPFGIFYSEAVLSAELEAGNLVESDIDTSVTRILTSMFAVGLFDKKSIGNPLANVTSDQHNKLAREIVSKSTVLLKNSDNLLPLNVDDFKATGSCIAVFGDEDTISGGGSGHVKPSYVVTPQQGISLALAGTNAKVLYDTGDDLVVAAEIAKGCAAAVVVVATTSSEGSDRANLSLGSHQDDLVSAIAAANKNTIVAVNTPGAVLMPWSEEVSALLVSWLPGQEAGNGLADVLFGKVNPSGRLPVTIPNKENEIGFTKREYPGIGHPPDATYSEGLLIGYRWYQANSVKPLFPFGHGLSYTTFTYSEIMLNARSTAAFARTNEIVASVTITLENSGSLAGSEVVQLYVSYPVKAREPPRQLRSFQKVSLNAGEKTAVTLSVSKRDLSIWDEQTTHDWSLLSGEYTLHVGSSCEDIRLSTTFKL